MQQSPSEQTLIARLLRANNAQAAVWLSGQLQQTVYMATNYRWIAGASRL